MKQKPIQYIDLTGDLFSRGYFSNNNRVLFSSIRAFLPISNSPWDLLLGNPNIPDTAFDDLLYLQDSSIPPDTADGKQVVLSSSTRLS